MTAFQLYTLFWATLTFFIGLVGGGMVFFLIGRAWERRNHHKLYFQIESLKKENKDAQDKLAWFEKANTKMAETFEALASQTLRTSSDELLKRAQEQNQSLMDKARGDWNLQKSEFQNLVEPLKTNLNALDSHVRELEAQRQGAYQGLQAQIENLLKT